MQGLRKSGAMYKLRLSNKDYQAVQLETGDNVLIVHYNEIMDVERTSLAEKLEEDFRTGQEAKKQSRTPALKTLANGYC